MIVKILLFINKTLIQIIKYLLNKYKYLVYLFSFLMLIFIFISAIEMACFDMKFYDSQHQKLTLYNQKINEYIGISEKELSDVTKHLLDYIQDNEDTLDYQLNIKGVDREVFNDKEKAHMVDVKNLYLNVNTIKSIIQIFTTFLSNNAEISDRFTSLV